MDAFGHDGEGVALVPVRGVGQLGGVFHHGDVVRLVGLEVVGRVEQFVRAEAVGDFPIEELEGLLVVHPFAGEAEDEFPPGGGEGEHFFFGVRSFHNSVWLIA